MNKQAALDRLSALENEAAELRKILGAPEGGPWMPKNFEDYYCIINDGSVGKVTWDADRNDMNMISIGNVYRTREEAERAVEKLKVMKELRDMAGGYEFENDGTNFTIYLNTPTDEVRVCDYSCSKQMCSVYFQTRESAQAAIDKLGDRLKVLFE